ncbi:NAD(P)-binding domain-containing protein [Vibrio sp. qd031]|uniref:NAD(P)-binding domain-containing protein n=1 Tax=Vibrio sp. qd031 TaxID=1603038 RepID=UPI001554F06B|nr:NAD(P)-binding domain-containing protein [Vibrio sp. qd031]
MTIAIIGSGNIGSDLTGAFGAAKHGVDVASIDEQAARTQAEALASEGHLLSK